MGAMAEHTGVVVGEVDGARSTSTLGRAVLTEALRDVDPVGATAVERETNWRRGYPAHFRRLTEAGLHDEATAVEIATQGLDALHQRMAVRIEESPGVFADEPLWQAVEHGRGDHLQTATVRGTGKPETTLAVPYRGKSLRGRELREQLAVWEQRGSMEPSAAAAIGRVIDHPQWLPLRDHHLVVLGASAEMGPLQPLLRWGAEVTALDLPNPALWKATFKAARQSAGTLKVPTSSEHSDPAQAAGADLLNDTATVTNWLAELRGPMVLGNYVYADGVTNLRLAAAVDAIGESLRHSRSDLGMAFLATPTDTFGVPAEAVEASVQAYRAGRLPRLARGGLRRLSGGRLLNPNYRPGVDPGLNDSVIAQQGPNYLLAKRIHRWRATVARRDGLAVSMNLAPPTRTRSVTKNRTLAAAYAGAHRFGIEVFAPDTANTIMAALLVHDLHHPSATQIPWREEADQAVHGGLWRTAYDPRSALGLAYLFGIGSPRG